MSVIQVYRCDRCGKRRDVSESGDEWRSLKLTYYEFATSQEQRNRQYEHLCRDCYDGFRVALAEFLDGVKKQLTS